MTKSKTEPTVHSSSPEAGPGGYIITVWPISRREHRFGVAGVCDGTTIHGEAITHRGGGLEYRPAAGMPALEDESQAYESLCEIFGDADPAWADSHEG